MYQHSSFADIHSPMGPGTSQELVSRDYSPPLKLDTMQNSIQPSQLPRSNMHRMNHINDQFTEPKEKRLYKLEAGQPGTCVESYRPME